MHHECDLDCKAYKEKDSPIPGHWQIQELSFQRCPKTQMTENVDLWIKAYRLFEIGLLPCGGGWLDQSNKYIEIMDFLSIEFAKINKARGEKNG